MPAYPSGTVEQQVLQQYSYLFQMAQQLNLALEAAESSRMAAVQAAGKSRAAQGTEQELSLIHILRDMPRAGRTSCAQRFRRWCMR